MDKDRSEQIAPAEFWPVEPPKPDVSFVTAVGKMIYYGADMAIGANDTLPTEPPPAEYYDIVKLILVAWEDVERVKHQLVGFLGFDPTASPPCSGETYTFKYGKEGTPPGAISAGMTFVHENRRTWLVVFAPGPMGRSRNQDHTFMVMPDIRGGNPKFRQRMLDRCDRQIQRDLAQCVMDKRRLDWSDIPFQHGKALLDTYEITGDSRYFDEVIDRTDEMLADVPDYPSSHTQMPTPVLVRLYEMTGQEKYLAPVAPLVDASLDEPEFRPGERGFLQTQEFMHADTYRVMKTELAGGAGTYADCIATHYMPAMLTAKALGRQKQMADLVAMAIKEAQRHLRDPETGLFYQSILGRRQERKCIPGHGTSWGLFAIGLILEAFDKDHSEYPAVLRIYQDLADAAARVQTPNGAFRCLLDIPAMPASSLYTPKIGCALLRAARMGFLSDEFRIRGLKAWEAIKLKTFQGGRLGDGSGSPVMSEYDAYFHTLTTENYNYTLRGNVWPLHIVNEVLRLGM